MNVMGSDDDDDDIDNKNENITNNCWLNIDNLFSFYTFYLLCTHCMPSHFVEIKVIWFMQPPGWEMYKING